MAKNTSKFDGAVQYVSNTSSNRNENLMATLAVEAMQFSAQKANYDSFADQTKMGDSRVILAGRDFGALRDLIAVGTTKDGAPMLTFNPAMASGSVSMGSQFDVNAIRDAFGTKRYAVLEYGLHERLFDRAATFARNVRSEKVNGIWKRYSWDNRCLVDSTPKVFVPREGSTPDIIARAQANKDEMVRWTGKHEAIDKLILSLLSGQKYISVFNDTYAYERLSNNLLTQMDNTIAEVVAKAGENVAAAQQVREIKLESSKVDLATAVCVVDGVDLKALSGQVISLTVLPEWRTLAYNKTVRCDEPEDLKWVAMNLLPEAKTILHLAK